MASKMERQRVEKFVSKKLFSKLLRGFTDYDDAYLKLEKESEGLLSQVLGL